MASCGGLYVQHKMWLYGQSFCTECSLQALTSDPEAIMAPLLTKLQQHPLRVACAARMVHALIVLAKPLKFPLHLTPLIVKAMEAVLSKLPGPECDDACSSLLTKCLEIMAGEPRPWTQVAGRVVSECLVAEKRRLARLHAATPDKVSELLACHLLTFAHRRTILKLFQPDADPAQVFDLLVRRLDGAKSLQGVTAVLEIAVSALAHLPDDECHQQRLRLHIPKLLTKLARCVLSRDQKLQMHAVTLLHGLLSRKDPDFCSSLMKLDICDAVCDAILSRHWKNSMAVLDCVSIMCTNEDFYKQDRAKQCVKSIMTCLVSFSVTDWEVYSAGLRVLGLILRNSGKSQYDSVGEHYQRIYKAVKSGLSSERDYVRQIAIHTAVYFLAAKEHSKLEWEIQLMPLVELVLQKDKDIASKETPSSSCKCLVLKLASSIVCWCSASEAKINVDLQNWVVEAVISHARECVLANCSRVHLGAYSKLITVVKLIFQKDFWKCKVLLAEKLATMGFLDHQVFLKKQEHIPTLCYQATLNVLNTLCSDQLNTTLDSEVFKATMTLLSANDLKAVFREAPYAEVTLCLLYFQAFFQGCQLKDFLCHLEEFLEANRDIPNHLAKTTLFLFACAAEKDQEIPQGVSRLLFRWSATPHSIFANHPSYVNWILGLNQRHMPVELQEATLALWMVVNEFQNMDQIICNAATLNTFMILMVRNPSFLCAKTAYISIRNAITQKTEEKINLIEKLWQKLPLYLMSLSAQDSTGYYGHAFLLNLASQFIPSDQSVIPFEALCTILPEILGRHTCAGNMQRWSLTIFESTFAVTEILIRLILQVRRNKEAELSIFLKSSQLLLALEMFLNSQPAISITFLAFKLTNALIEGQIQLFSTSSSKEAPLKTTIVVLPSVLLKVILCSANHLNCQDTIVIMNFVIAVIKCSQQTTNPLVEIGSGSEKAVFASQFYKLVHVLISKHPGSDLELVGWRCLHALLNWKEDKWLCHSPWSHSLIWTKDLTLQNADCTREMLIYLNSFFTRLYENRQKLLLIIKGGKSRGNGTKMTNKTAVHLLTHATYLAFGLGCKDELCDVFSSVLALEYELRDDVKTAISSKLLELQFSG